MVMAPWEKAQMDPPTAKVTADSINADITVDNALLPRVLFKPNLGSPFNINKKGVRESLGELHQFDVVHARGAVELEVDGCASTEESTLKEVI